MGLAEKKCKKKEFYRNEIGEENCRVICKDRDRYSVLRARSGFTDYFILKIERFILRWFVHVKLISDEFMTKQI